MVALIVEDGSNVPNANSYVDLTYIRSFAEARGVLLPVDDASVQILAISAMDYIEAQRSRFQGSRTYPDQELQWPRSGVLIDCAPFPSDQIPVELKKAQAQLVIEQLEMPDLSPSTDGYAVAREKVDVIEVEYASGRLSGTATSVATPTFPKVAAFLDPLIFCCGSGFRLTLRRA